jgi:YHS domain-containing protein
MTRVQNQTNTKGTIMAEKDPVCGMMVEPDNAAAKADHKGKTYYFCSVDCKEEFEEDPDSYI